MARSSYADRPGDFLLVNARQRGKKGLSGLSLIIPVGVEMEQWMDPSGKGGETNSN